MLRRTIKHSRNRRTNSPVNQPQTVNPVYIINSVKFGSVLTLTFDQTVSLNGTPKFQPILPPNIASVSPIRAEQLAPNVVAITFSGDIMIATNLDLAFRDPAIRSASGGYVTARTLALAA